jgi:hypothetical protein
LICLRIKTSGGLLWTLSWTFGFHKMLENSWVAAQLAVSQERLISMELVSIHWSMKMVLLLQNPYATVIQESDTQLNTWYNNLMCRPTAREWVSKHASVEMDS